MDAVKYLKERNRMCDTFGLSCSGCPLGNSVEDCDDLQRERPEKAVAIVEKWSKEHPQKTMLQDFLEKYPNAPKECTGEPHICPSHLGYEEYMDCEENCLDCWSRPLQG
jgi:hypothetical protein